MSPDKFQLTLSAAQVYEDQKVSAIFEPLARATLEIVPLSACEEVLDAACGTGIVARSIRDRYGADLPVTGADLNADMISLARELTSHLVPPIQWVVADATAMPFPAGSFSVCFCQQGLQFLPDKAAAVREFRRVLKPNGRIAISVWAGVSPFFVAMADALRRHVSETVADRSLAPFAFQASSVLPPILADADFGNIEVHTLNIDRILKDPETAIRKEIFGNPIGPAVDKKGVEAVEKIVADIMFDCARFAKDGSLVVPQKAHLFTASACD